MSYHTIAEFQVRAGADPTEGTMDRRGRFQQLDFSRKPLTARETPNSKTCEYYVSNKLGLLSSHSPKSLGLMHLSTQEHQHRDAWRLALTSAVTVPAARSMVCTEMKFL